METAEAEQMIDLTAVLYSQLYEEPVGEIPEETIVPISSKNPLVRTINLLSQTIAIIYVEEEGSYRLVTAPESLADWTYRFLYFFDPEAYASVEYQEAGSAFELGVGYYFLELTPKNEGILSFAVMKDGTADLPNENVREVLSEKTSPPRHSFIWSEAEVPRVDNGETGIIDNL